jgi:ubiquinone/menaquinone biosynthesis C-methylase UbiE
MAKLSAFGKFWVNRFNARFSKRAFDLFRERLALDDSHCLEIGAGKGFLSYLIFQHYHPRRLVVTDYDPSQVKEARRLFEIKLGDIPSSVEFRAADALELPFEDGTFHAVFAMAVLHHVEKRDWQFKNIPKALNEVRRVLKPRGAFVYRELFNKNAIRRTLTSLGFQEVFARRQYPITDFCIYRRDPLT